MHITYLGHASFLVETEELPLVTDPWLSPLGAFDSAWFQYPCNHHLGPERRERLERTEKPIFAYVSHEHRDHFDPEFLKTLPVGRMTFLLPHSRCREARTACPCEQRTMLATPARLR